MKWIIFEDSLEDRSGHWFEYLTEFRNGLIALGDEVRFVVSKRANRDILDNFDGNPLLPESPFKKMSNKTTLLKRLIRIKYYVLEALPKIKEVIRLSNNVDIIFIPTVVIESLLTWLIIIKTTRLIGKRILLFFPGLPIKNSKNVLILDGSPTSYIFKLGIHFLAREVKKGNVILGVETKAMKVAAENLFKVPFMYFPHPVSPIRNEKEIVHKHLVMGCYGAARYEKGSDLLISAIAEYLRRYPESNARFIVQWLNDYSLPTGETASIDDISTKDPRINIVNHLFKGIEYHEQLLATDVLLLPYRCTSYKLRVSRVVIEALCNGIPVVVTKNSTLEADASDYGSSISVNDEDIESIVMGIHAAETNYSTLKESALKSQKTACASYSVQKFRSILLGENITTSKNYTLRGWYGEDNLGDDLLLEIMLEKLPKNIHLNIIGRKKGIDKLILNRCNTKAIEAPGILKKLYRVINSDGIILGGGGLFPNKKDSIGVYLELLLSAFLNKKTIILGIGVNPNKTGLELKYWSYIIKNSTYVSVRDNKSKSFLQSCSNSDSIIHMHHDLVFSQKLPTSSIPHILIKKPYVLLNPAWFPTLFKDDGDIRMRKLADEYANATKYLQESGFNVVIISFFPRDDQYLTDFIKRSYELSGVTFLSYDQNFSLNDIYSIFLNSSFCVCMRFHALVMAIKCRKNLAAICYDYKSSSLLETVHLQDAGMNYGLSSEICLGYNADLEEGSLVKLIERRLKVSHEVEQTLASVLPVIIKESNLNFSEINNIFG